MPVEVNLAKSDNSTPWGFRLQGGKDFGAPLTVQRINPGSIAAQCGLLINDVIVSINDSPTAGLRHKDAQDLIIQGGNSIRLFVDRDGNYRPKVDTSSTCQMRAPEASRHYPIPVDIPTTNYGSSAVSSIPEHGLGPTSKLSTPVTATKYVPSSTCQLVRDIEAGKGPAVSPLTGAQIRTSPAQSKLHTMLDKKCQLTDSDSTPVKQEPSSARPDAPAATAAGSSLSSRAGPAPYTAPQYHPAPTHSPSAAAPASAAGSRSSPAADGPSTATAASSNHIPVPAVFSSSKIPVCNVCKKAVTGQYVTALDKIWCRDHFVCSAPSCQRSLVDCGFVEEDGQVFCEEDYEKYLAPRCAACDRPISTEVVKAMGKSYHPNCFACAACEKPIHGGTYHLNDGLPYCDKDWKTKFQTKCFACEFAIEPGDQWIDALSHNWHSECFNCTTCKVNLESEGFYNKGGRPYCKVHSTD